MWSSGSLSSETSVEIAPYRRGPTSYGRMVPLLITDL